MRPQGGIAARIRIVACASALCLSATACLEPPAVTSVERQGASFNHAGVTSNCTACHANDRPAATLAQDGSLIEHGNGGDCVLCHVPGGSFLQVTAMNHVPTPAACASCHESKRPGPTQLVPPVPLAPGFQFVHSAQFGGNADCVACHTTVIPNVGVTWAGGFYDHRSAGAKVGTCLPCHVSRRPAGDVGNPPFNHAAIGSTDCASCHKEPGITWSTAAFNHNVTPALAQCASCHAGERPSNTTLVPAGATKNLFYHAASNNGLSDCVLCHTAVQANIGVTWAGGTFDHKDNTGTYLKYCNVCHLTEKPTAGPQRPFDHTVVGPRDCGECHLQRAGTVWTDGRYDHQPVQSKCALCHEGGRIGPGTKRPAPNARFNGRVTDGSDAIRTSPTFVHAAAYNGLADCITCHSGSMTDYSTFRTGYWDHRGSNGALVTSCTECHSVYAGHPATGNAQCTACHRTYGGRGSSFNR